MSDEFRGDHIFRLGALRPVTGRPELLGEIAHLVPETEVHPIYRSILALVADDGTVCSNMELDTPCPLVNVVARVHRPRIWSQCSPLARLPDASQLGNLLPDASQLGIMQLGTNQLGV